MNRRKWIFVLKAMALAVFISTPPDHLFAQSTKPDFVSSSYTIENGLVHNQVNHVFVDHHELIWVGTQNGLNRIEGANFKLFEYDPENTHALSNDFVLSMRADGENGVWIGSMGGLDYYEYASGTFRNFNIPNIDGLLINEIAQGRDGILFLATNVGLYAFERTSASFAKIPLFDQEEANLSERLFDVAFHEDALWVGTDGLGLVEYDLSSWTFDQTETPFLKKRHEEGSIVRALEVTEGGVVWFGAYGKGLFEVRNGVLTDSLFVSGESSHGLTSNLISDIHIDTADRLWLGTNNQGLFLFNPLSGRFENYSHDPFVSSSLSHDNVYSITSDSTGALLVGTFNGLSRLVPSEKSFSFYSYQEQVNSRSSNIKSFIELADDKVLLATLGSGLKALDLSTGVAEDYAIPMLDSSSRVLSLFRKDGSDDVWIGTADSGVIRHNLTTKGNQVFLDGAGGVLREHHYIVYRVFVDSEERVWIGTHENGLMRLDPGSQVWVTYNVSEEEPYALASNQVNIILEDDDHNIWAGSYSGGLAKISQSEVAAIYRHDRMAPNSLSNDDVTSLIEYPTGTLWIGTQGGGVNQFNEVDGVMNHYSTQEGLADDLVTALSMDKNNNIWVATAQGLSRIDTQTGDVITYNQADNLGGDDFNTGAFHQLRDGRMLLGRKQNTVLFDPEQLFRGYLYRGKVLVSGLLVDNETVPVTDSGGILTRTLLSGGDIDLSWDDRSFAIEFALAHSLKPWHHTYSYRLIDHQFRIQQRDTSWSSYSRPQFAQFPDLRPGRYKFEVKAVSSDGQASRNVASALVRLRAPWYRQWWALASYFVASLLLVVSVVRIRTKALYRRAEQLEATVKIRTKELRSSNEALANKTKELEELDQFRRNFFQNISHEFRTPLTLILGPVRDAIEGAYGKIPARFKSQLKIVERSGEDLRQLIDQILDLAKLDSGETQLYSRPLNIATFAQDLTYSFKSLADHKDIDLSFGSERNEFYILADDDKVKRILTNLLSNAFKFTPNGGKISVRLASEEKEEGLFVALSVSDNGAGIAQDKQQQIFERFRQGDASSTRIYGGTGIGLALVKELVELHEGEVRLESQLGEGSTFIVSFPLIETPIETIWEDLVENEGTDPDILSELAQDHAQVPAHASWVLLVEDHPEVRQYVKSVLASRYHIAEAENGVEGLKQVQERKPDLIISDVMMPMMDGIDFSKAIKESEEYADIPIILLTARADDEDRYEGLGVGVDDYIVKPFKARDLLIRTENLIDVRQALRLRYSEEMRIGPENKVVKTRDGELLETLREYVQANLQNVKATDLADHVGMSPRHLNRKLFDLLELKANGYITMMRLERATQLLVKNKSEQVSQIGYEVGFENANYFTRLFKSHFKVTPKQYQKGERGIQVQT